MNPIFKKENVFIEHNKAFKSNEFEGFIYSVNRIGFEPMTCCLEGSCSIQLSYRSKQTAAKIGETAIKYVRLSGKI